MFVADLGGCKLKQMHCVHCMLIIHHTPIPMTNAHLSNIKEPTKEKNSCAKHERRHCYTIAREASHCYPHLHHDSKISKVAWYLLVPWLRLLRLGSAFPVQSFHLWRPFCSLAFGLEVWSYAPQRKTHRSESAMVPTKLTNDLCCCLCRRATH